MLFFVGNGAIRENLSTTTKFLFENRLNLYLKGYINLDRLHKYVIIYGLVIVRSLNALGGTK